MPPRRRCEFKKHKVASYKLEEQPLLETQDFVERKAWVDAHLCRSPTQWVRFPHAIIDNKSFQMTDCRKGREFAARRSVRGP